MNRLFRRLASWSVERRWPSLLLIVLLSAAAVIGWKFTELQQLVLSDDAGSEAVDDDSQARRNRRRRGGAAGMFDSHSILVVESKHLFTPDGATALRQIVDELESLDYVNHVLWMDRIPVLNVFGLSEPLFPRSGASDRRFAAAKEKALNNPLVVGQLLSQDAETLLMLLTFDLDFVFSNEEVTSELKKTAIAAAADFPELELKFQVTGNYPAFIAAVGQHESNQTLFMSVGFGMIALMALILFRGLQTVVIVSIAPAVGVAWTLGMIQFVKYSENNGLIDIVLPVLVALVAITDGVHLMVQTRKLRASGMSAQEAAQKGLQQVGFACFLTSFTTAIGFASLTLADHSMVQDFGKCCVIGVVMSFLSVVTIIPLLCSTRLGRDIHVGLENSLIDRHLSRISGLIDVVLKHRRILSLTGIVATVVLFAVCLTLEPDQRARDNLPANAEATIAMNHLDKVLGGLESSQIEVHWPEHVRADDPLILEAVMAVDDILRTEELIGHPLSIRDLIEAQPGSGPLAERMSMLELLPPPIKDIFISPEERRAIVTFRVQDLGIARYGPVFERVEASLAGFATQFSGFEFELVGSAARRWRNLYQIVVDLAASLGTASVIIFVVLAFVFRSVRIGLISIVPNLFPLVLSGTWLVVSGYNLEVVMVCCFTICLGIAVDDTIHFLSRYHEELKESSGTLEAIRRAFTGVGTALIMTTLVLVAGFSTVMFSGNRDYFIFAVMGAITIAAALFADLIFLPPLLARFAPHFTAATKDPLPTGDVGCEEPVRQQIESQKV